MSCSEKYTLQKTQCHVSYLFLFFFSSLSEQLEEESVLGVSIWLKLSEIMSSPPLHLTTPLHPPSFPSSLPPSHLLSIDWLSCIILETPLRGSFLSIKRRCGSGAFEMIARIYCAFLCLSLHTTILCHFNAS